MRNERFVRGYESVKLDQPIKEAMLNRILAEKNQGDSVYKSKKHTSFRRLLPVAWAAAILLCVATLPQFYLPQNLLWCSNKSRRVWRGPAECGKL